MGKNSEDVCFHVHFTLNYSDVQCLISINDWYKSFWKFQKVMVSDMKQNVILLLTHSWSLSLSSHSRKNPGIINKKFWNHFLESRFLQFFQIKYQNIFLSQSNIILAFIWNMYHTSQVSTCWDVSRKSFQIFYESFRDFFSSEMVW